MRKMLIFLALLWVGRVTAQVTETTEGGDVQQTMDDLFHYVNMDYVPYGLLMNKAIYFDNIHKYDGVTISDSTDVNINTFGWLYSMLGMANIGTNELPDGESLYGTDSYQEGSPVPLVVMCEKYGHFKSTIFDNNLIRFENNQLSDIFPRPESPYIEGLVFVASPIINTFKTGNLSFVIPADRIIQNVGGVQNVSIDFGTGNGFQSVTLGQPFNVSLPSGMTRAIMQVRVRKGKYFQTLQCRFEIDVAPSVVNTPVPESGGIDDIYRPTNSLSETFTETRPQDGTKLIIAEVTTYYACADGQLRKPLFVLDGFNTGTDDNVNADGVTTKGFLDFFNGYTTTPISTASIPRFITQDLRKEGYDLIFVNWKSEEGRDDLRRNAYMLQQIIARMNTRKSISKSIEKNVIIGLSMGGVIAKYALLDLERQNPNAVNGGHDCKLFIGYDAPMQGANIPLGFQYLVKDLGDQILGGALGRNIGGLKKGLKSLKSSAARQLLSYQAFDLNPKFPLQFTSFYNELNGMGKLQKCDYKTVSNGSMVGTPNFPAGKQLLGGGTPIPLGIALPSVAFAIYMRLDVRTLPPTSQSNEVIYDRTLIGFIRVLTVAIPIPVLPRLTIFARDMRPLDGAPGGTTGLTGGLNIPLVKGGKYDDGNREDLRTTFIPAVSALDIKSPQGDNVFLNVSNQQSLITNNVVPTTGFVGSRSSSQFDAAVFLDNPVNRVENQVHAGLSYRTTGFLLYELMTRNTLQTSANVTLNNRTYNFGKSSDPYQTNLPQPNGFQPKGMNNIIDYTLNVENTGQLWVNRVGRIAFVEDVVNPANGTNSAYSLIIRQAESCKSNTDNALGIVNIRNNGIMRVGDGSTNNPTNVKILKGGTLKIQADGSLILERSGTIITIENGGELVVEASGNLNLTGIGDKIIVKQGGKLIINGGANINLTGFESSILIEWGGELVINGNMNFTGVGYFQFDTGHKLTLNSDLVLRGSGKTNTMIKLTDAPPGTENKLVINGRSVNISNALVSYGIDSRIEVTSNSSLQTNVFTDVTFSSANGVNGQALKLQNTARLTIMNCDFNNLIQGVAINGNSSVTTLNISISNSIFSSVNGISMANFIAHPQGCPSTTIANCTFTYNATLASFTGTACKFENIACGISFYGGQFTGYRQGNSWSNFTGIELIGAKMQNYGTFVISDFKTGIYATNLSNISLIGGAEIKNCETGINAIESTVNLYCSKLIDNLTGVKGTNVKFGSSGDGREIGSGNEFKTNPTAPNSLLFDIFYPAGTPDINYTSFRAANNFWNGGFSETKFNLYTGLCAGCTTLNSVRLEIEQCTEIQSVCSQTGSVNCCGQIVKTSNGLTASSYTKQCFVGGGGSSDALVMKKPDNQVATKADSDKFKIYPNPANETVKLDIKSGDYHLRVLNTVGQTIFAQNTEGAVSVNVATWTNGIYLFELTEKATNKQQRSKIVVQH